jgi:hypothetical protein
MKVILSLGKLSSSAALEILWIMTFCPLSLKLAVLISPIYVELPKL